MKKYFTVLGFMCVVLFFGCSEKESHQEKEAVFLIAGQSNASGVGDKEISVFVPNKEVYEYNSVKDTLNILKDPVGKNHLNFQEAQTGSFIPALAYSYNELSNQKVTVIQAAKGGSSLTIEGEVNNWGNWSECGKLFSSSIYKTQKALQVLKQTEIDAVFWSQGENDGQALSKNLITTEEYKNSLVDIIKRYQSYFGNKVPFIMIETGRIVGSESKDNGYTKVREIQREVAQKMQNVFIGYNETEFFIERDWLVDVVHYNQEALNDIGKKLAYFYASLEER